MPGPTELDYNELSSLAGGPALTRRAFLLSAVSLASALPLAGCLGGLMGEPTEREEAIGQEVSDSKEDRWPYTIE